MHPTLSNYNYKKGRSLQTSVGFDYIIHETNETRNLMDQVGFHSSETKLYFLIIESSTDFIGFD